MSLLTNEAFAALDSGCQIVSTNNSAVNGTYAIDEQSLTKLFRTGAYCLAYSSFPNNQASWTILDLSGSPKTFMSTSEYLSTLRGIADYVAQLEQIIDGLSTLTQLPAQPVQVP